MGFVSPVTVVNLEAAVDEYWSAQAAQLKFNKEQMYRSGPLSLRAFINPEATDQKVLVCSSRPTEAEWKTNVSEWVLVIADASGLQVIKIILITQICYVDHQKAVGNYFTWSFIALWIMNWLNNLGP